MVRDEQGNPSRSHVRYRFVGGSGRGRAPGHNVFPLNQQPTRLVTAAHRGREAGERGAMTAQIINLAEVRAERERRRALSLFEFWFLVSDFMVGNFPTAGDRPTRDSPEP